MRLFGVYPRKYLAPPTPATAEDARDWRRTGREAVAACGGPQPGPVHINCSFDEPLVPTGEVVDVPARDPARVELPDRHPEPLAADVERMAHELSGARGVVVAGSSWWMPPDQMSLLAERLGWPLLAEPTSGLRRPGRALATGQALIRSAGFAERHRPEVVLQIGAAPTTRATQTLVAAAERLLVVDRFHPEPDPEREASWRLDADPRHVAAAVMAHEIEPAPVGWSAGWSDHDERARRAMDDVLDTTDEPTELRLARDLAAAVPDGGTLFVGNSTPIRDVDIAMAPRDGLQVLANRGASGIDGLVSTALGMATADRGATFALIGDLSLLHDVGALLWNGRRSADLVLVVPNNGGGAIFGSLGQRTLPERDRLFVTPHDLDLALIAAAGGVEHRRVEQMSRLDAAFLDARAAGGIQLIEVSVPAERSREQRADVQAAVDLALAVR